MHDDHLRSLLRTLEREHEPDPEFADALYGRLAVVARAERRSRGPMLLLAAALLVLLAAGLAFGSGLVRLPVVLEPTPSASALPSTVAVASPSLEPSLASPAPSMAPSPSEAAEPAAVAGRVVMAMANGLAMRAEPTADGALVARVNAGQAMGVVSGPVDAEELRWYEVRIGPGDMSGWVSSGPDGAWLRLVDEGAVGFICDDGCGAAALVSVDPFGDSAITALWDAASRDWAWSPDGTRIAATFDAGGTVEAEIVVMDADGSDRRTVGTGYGPAWSPDGSRLAWSVGTTLVVTDDQLVPAELDLDVRSAGTPMWSPDGSSLAFSAIDCQECPDEPIAGDPPIATWIVGIDGGGLRQLTGGDYSGLVDWSPDGTTLAFFQVDLSGEHPTRAYTLPVAGGERTYLEGGGAITGVPSWSPDGHALLYATPLEIVVASGVGSSPAPVVATPDAGLESLGWSPSGRWVLYGSLGVADGARPAIWVAPVDGGTPPGQISPTDATASRAAWQAVLQPLR